MKNLDRYKADISRMIKLGDEMLFDLRIRLAERQKIGLDKDLKEAKKKLSGQFEKSYHNWYNEAHATIKQLLPDRLMEFEKLYKADSKRKDLDIITFSIQDWLMGYRAALNGLTGKTRFDDLSVVCGRFQMQLDIFRSVDARFESSLFNIKQLLQADLFDSEIETARELLKKGFIRASGVVAGVVLESHLLQVCLSHGITIKKKEPTISQLNDELKNNNVVEVAQWRFIQRLGDFRNLCGHQKNREPISDEITELIDGVVKTMKTLF